MKTYTDYLWFDTRARQEFVRITDQVAAVVAKSGVVDGMCSCRRCTSRRAST